MSGTWKSSLPFVLLLGLLALLVAVPAGAAPAATKVAKQSAAERYIVVLKPSADAEAVADEHARRFGASPFAVYRHALKGYAAKLAPARVAALKNDPRVLHVEPDQLVHALAQTTPTGVKRVFAPANAGVDIDGQDDYRVDVDVAVIDTGVDYTHPDLTVVDRVDCASGAWWKAASCKANSGSDGNGHGTHVAGTVGALDNDLGVVGVAPGARIWAVRVLDNSGSGYMSWIVAGIDYVTANASQIEVANMSLGCECTSDAMNTAIANSVNAGVVYAVAAGNSDKNASTFSPANHPDVITVSALADSNGLADTAHGSFTTCRTDEEDTLANFSNYGSSVELVAPGVCILSTVPGGYATYSGTSMASPHVAGAAALLTSKSKPSNKSDVFAVRSILMNEGNLNWHDDSGDGVTERLLDVSDSAVFAPKLVAGAGGGTTNNPPTAAYTYSCSNLSCSFNGSGSNDPNGDALTYSWSFGDGTTATGVTASRTYAAAGDYTVTLTVSDGKGGQDDEVKTVTVSDSTATFSLTQATGYKIKGWQYADLSWAGSGAANVDVWRRDNGGTYQKITTTANDGAYTDDIRKKGGGSYTYKVCEAATATCTNEVTVTF